MSIKKPEERMMMPVGKMCAEKNYWQRRRCSEKRRRRKRRRRRRSNNTTTTIIIVEKNQKHRNGSNDGGGGGGSVSEAVIVPPPSLPPLCWSSTSLMAHLSTRHCPNNCIDSEWKWSSLLMENILLLNNNQQIIFHPRTSSSTRIVLADRPLPSYGKHYWEMFVPAVYGTSMMFGIATREQKLVSPKFINLLGADRHGWALSHHGLIWHDGIARSFLSQSMEPLRPILIGLQFDADARTLSYIIDNQPMGIAFHSIPNDVPIYPAVSSTSAQSTVVLRHRCKMCSSLRETCLKLVKSTMRVNTSCCQLLPRHLIAQLPT